jgi:hypothetical protein
VGVVAQSRGATRGTAVAAHPSALEDVHLGARVGEVERRRDADGSATDDRDASPAVHRPRLAVAHVQRNSAEAHGFSRPQNAKRSGVPVRNL